MFVQLPNWNEMGQELLLNWIHWIAAAGKRPRTVYRLQCHLGLFQRSQHFLRKRMTQVRTKPISFVQLQRLILLLLLWQVARSEWSPLTQRGRRAPVRCTWLPSFTLCSYCCTAVPLSRREGSSRRHDAAPWFGYEPGSYRVRREVGLYDQPIPSGAFFTAFFQAAFYRHAAFLLMIDVRKLPPFRWHWLPSIAESRPWRRPCALRARWQLSPNDPSDLRRHYSRRERRLFLCLGILSGASFCVWFWCTTCWHYKRGEEPVKEFKTTLTWSLIIVDDMLVGKRSCKRRINKRKAFWRNKWGWIIY